MREFNKKCSITSTPNGTFGVQQSLRDRLLLRIGHLHQDAPEDALSQVICVFLLVYYIVTYSIMYLEHIYPTYIHACRATQTIRVKLSGDGTTVEKRIHCVTFSFTLLDEAHSVSLVDGVHPIAIFREPESYESLSLALENVIQEVAELTSGIEVQGVHYNVSIDIFNTCNLYIIAVHNVTDYVLLCSSTSAARLLPWWGLEVSSPCDWHRCCNQRACMHMVQVPKGGQMGHFYALVHH